MKICIFQVLPKIASVQREKHEWEENRLEITQVNSSRQLDPPPFFFHNMSCMHPVFPGPKEFQVWYR